MNAARRLQRRRRWPHLAETAPVGITAGIGASGAVELWQVVRALPRRQREALALHYLVDLPVAEVARLMGGREDRKGPSGPRSQDAARNPGGSAK